MDDDRKINKNTKGITLSKDSIYLCGYYCDISAYLSQDNTISVLFNYRNLHKKVEVVVSPEFASNLKNLKALVEYILYCFHVPYFYMSESTKQDFFLRCWKKYGENYKEKLH